MDPTPVCNCTGGTCGESCLNAMLRTECVCGNGIRARQELLLGGGCVSFYFQVFLMGMARRLDGLGWR